ncbi:MAG: Methionyl-tRNA formyltransferase [Planctomycetota bacterium]
MRLVMMGTGPFAVPTFEALLDSKHAVLALVTRPAVVGPRGRAPANPMREAAERRGVTVWDPANANDDTFVRQLLTLHAELLVVCDYGQILKPPALAAARLGGINLHGSLLPRYRGAAPVQWAVYEGDAETGVSVIHMTPLLDGGPVLEVRRVPIDEAENAAELESRLSRIGVEAVLSAIETLAGWDGHSELGQRQDPALATKAPRISKQQGAIDWRLPALRIRNQIRAFQPWPGAYTFWLNARGGPLRLALQRAAMIHPPGAATLATATVENPAASPAPDAPAPSAPIPDAPAHAVPAHADSLPVSPGTVVAASGSSLQIATGAGRLAIEQLQVAGKRSMSVAEFLRGYPVAVGDQFGDVAESR